MTGIAITAFRGAVPRTSDRLLQPNQATQALNCKITSGRLDPLKGLGLVHTSDIAGTIATMYRYRHLGVDNWLVWDKVVDVTRSPVAQDSLGRFFYTGDGEPRMSTYADAITGGGPYPAAWYVLGVAFPVTAPSIAVTGGVGINEERTYVYTFKNRYGEESGPSPRTTFTGKVDGSWDLSTMDVAPPNTGAISAAVKDTPLPGQVEVTLDSVFGLAAYEELTFAGVTGMTDLNGKFSLVSVDAATNKVVVALATTQTYSAAADTWTRVAPHNTAGMVKRIYRTIGTNTDYKLVTEIPVANATYSDTIPATTVAKNSGITTLDNFPPPKNLHSLALLANGAMAGIDGNEFCMSEQGKPYSWPIAYRQSFPGTGVGLVAAGNAAIILTDSYPLVATATVPESLTITKIPGDTLAPCLTKRGIVDIGSGAIFPGHDGLYVATTSGCTNITTALFTYDEWQALQPETFKAAQVGPNYYAMHDGSSAVPAGIFQLNTKEADGTLGFSEQANTLYGNPWDGRLYVGKANTISQWDEDDNNRYSIYWQSGDFQLGQPVNLSVAQVQAKFSDIRPVNNSILDANTALMADVRNVNGEIACAEVLRYEIAGSAILPVPAQTMASVQYTLMRDGLPVFTKQVTSNDAFKLPGDAMSDLYAHRITSSIPVYSVNAAQGMAELKQASV